MNPIENNYGLLDVISIINFFIGIKNLQENVEQGNVQEILENHTHNIHKHLDIQDKKINEIISRLEVITNDDKRNIQ